MNEHLNEVMTLRLTAINYLARNTSAFTFEDPQGNLLPAAEPGSHVGVVLANGLMRQYSLLESSNSLTQRSYVIGVKLDPQSRGGSSYMHQTMRVGDLVTVEAPRNNFPLNEDAAHTVLVAGGIGITPILCMARRLKELGQSPRIYYSCRERVDVAFAEELKTFEHALVHVDAETGRFLNIADIVKREGRNAHFYCCGPGPMLEAFEVACAALPLEQVHVEYFTAKQAAALDGNFVVELRKSGKTLTVPQGKTILSVVREAGVSVSYSCEEGVCGACEVRVLEGEPDHRDAILSEPEKAANKTMIICCSGCKSDRLVLDL
ncbi:PDR/VanB family oxidoreductase [Paraburkholderia rhynchosiae]|uniref:Oxidoreductase n=1 Tax=Paraburkholderia rhynchosiae TaxID=487049 RepID=A0A2N7WDR8_9BURK|nr:PDR/VanB family oxidoreductase [Paraburkholderia rhynchosiae]PMS27495.1 oxidoreductase [Paraburkholderia rhynchosiae]CAB3723661.1 Phenoxybenzoate dioxygenase subunit beta [Paraburkholderia rhynchosiae]